MNPAMQRQYPGNYQQIHRSPHHPSSSRRPQAPMVPHVSHSKAQANQLELQQREDRRRAFAEEERAKRRSEKPTDRNMPDGVEEMIVGDGVQQYKRLREMERKLDAIMMRKKLDQQDSLHNAVKKYRTLRIWISNTVENQPWQGGQMDENAFDFTMGSEATYKVKIEGRLLEDEDEGNEDSDDEDGKGDARNGTDMDQTQDGETASSPNTSNTPAPRQPPKMSHFFKAITVDFDRNKNLQPDGTTQIEWKKQPQPQQGNINPSLPSSAEFDCLEFERKSDENINCTINFYRDETPERYQLSKEMAALLDTTEDDRTSVIMGIWEYIKAMGLTQDDDKRIQCDDRMKAVFRTETLTFPQIPTLIQSHLKPLPPLSLPYTIRVDSTYNTSPQPTIYTLTLPTTPPPPSLPSSLPTLKQLSAYDDHLALLVQALSRGMRKRAFLEGYARDPVAFVKRWMGSQRRDLDVILGEGGRWESEQGGGLGGEWRVGGRGGVWGSERVREGVGLLVQRGGKDGRAF